MSGGFYGECKDCGGPRSLLETEGGKGRVHCAACERARYAQLTSALDTFRSTPGQWWSEEEPHEKLGTNKTPSPTDPNL